MGPYELFDELGASIAPWWNSHGDAKDEGLRLCDDRGESRAHFDHARHAVHRSAPPVEIHRLGEQSPLALFGPERIERQVQPTREPWQERRRARAWREVEREKILPPLERLPHRLEDEKESAEEIVVVEQNGEVLHVLARTRRVRRRDVMCRSPLQVWQHVLVVRGRVPRGFDAGNERWRRDRLCAL